MGHIRTTWGSFPLSDTSLMTPAERSRFIEPVRVFTNVLEKGNADANEVTQLMQYAQELMRDMNVNGNNFNFGDFDNQNQRFNNQDQHFNNQRNQQFNNQRNQQFNQQILNARTTTIAADESQTLDFKGSSK